ncbi:hypothetical protein QYE76_071298 [Lolium multiflorum]|uniref:E3 ubiquitin-protein ligase synoviolin-like TPR repeats domain-containing protein n=1 Tax=Lolium multiflorum TaxID=4521 RepID=A0AAD8WES1_LOLMU|nr:hypothetical protein QYE76_071298 [Lolium multiflorum]
MDVAYDITRLPEVIPHLSPVQVPFLPNPTNQEKPLRIGLLIPAFCSRSSEFAAEMILLQTYAALSLLATTAAAYHAFNTRGQFYPAMAHLSASKPCLVLLLNVGLVAMCAA